jgi:hypothetical protein
MNLDAMISMLLRSSDAGTTMATGAGEERVDIQDVSAPSSPRHSQIVNSEILAEIRAGRLASLAAMHGWSNTCPA